MDVSASPLLSALAAILQALLDTTVASCSSKWDGNSSTLNKIHKKTGNFTFTGLVIVPSQICVDRS